MREERTIYPLDPTRNIAGKTKVMEYRSDYLGRMEEIVYPDREVVRYEYDQGGQIRKVTGVREGEEFPYVKEIGYDEYGQRIYMEYGNGVKTEYRYDEKRRWLEGVRSEGATAVYQDIKYEFDAVGNISKYENGAGRYRTEQQYEYDGLYQLVKAEGESRQYLYDVEHKYEAEEGALPYRFTGKELDDETGFYYYGARYLDPKTSRWISGDPAMGDYIPGAPINDDVKKRNQNLSGGGGIFNLVNLHTFHYAGNNPLKYTDPDGREVESLDETKNSQILKNIEAVCGQGFIFDDKNTLQFDETVDAGGNYSPTAREMLIGAINSDKTAYILPLTPSEFGDYFPPSSVTLGGGQRVSGEPGNTIGIYMYNFRSGAEATLKNEYGTTLSQASDIGFIHEFLGHAVSDMGIPGYNKQTDVMQLERTIRAELGWGQRPYAASEPANLDGVPLFIRKQK